MEKARMLRREWQRLVVLLVFNLRYQRWPLPDIPSPIPHSPVVLTQREGGKYSREWKLERLSKKEKKKKLRGEKDLGRQKKNNKRKITLKSYWCPVPGSDLSLLALLVRSTNEASVTATVTVSEFKLVIAFHLDFFQVIFVAFWISVFH